MENQETAMGKSWKNHRNSFCKVNPVVKIDFPDTKMTIKSVDFTASGRIDTR